MARPRGLRLSRAGGSWWRIDPSHPAEWAWEPHPLPVGRFDPLSGRFRLRYAANLPAAAARERFPARTLTDADGELWLVELRGFRAVLNLTHQANLDALGLDDRISTGRLAVSGRRGPDPLLETSGRLADAVHDWWGGTPPPLVYRTRTMPGAGRSIAFGPWVAVEVGRVGRLRRATALHAHLVLHAGFTVPPGWLA